jgi:hypothetical protein
VNVVSDQINNRRNLSERSEFGLGLSTAERALRLLLADMVEEAQNGPEIVSGPETVPA